jgi:hypothetical protein
MYLNAQIKKFDPMKLIFALLVSAILLSSCQENAKKVQSFSTGEKTSESMSQAPTQKAASYHHVIVKEVLQTSKYTYLFVTENDTEFWIAVRRLDTKVGDDVYYYQSLPMQNFKSKELDRVFETVLFIQGNTSTPPSANKIAQIGSKKMPAKVDKKIEGIKVNTPQGGISIAELFKNKEKYEGQKVKVSGQIVKVNNGIMGKNWIHIQDGTADSDNYDLTFTSQNKAEMGQVVTIEGTVYLKKEFGAGYSYDLIIEEAVIQ